MDYTQIPRALIYKDRTDLKDFGVHIPGTMNYLLFSNLKDLFKATDRAKELILRCFNNAYYICTIIPFEDFPETQVAEYEKLLLKGDPYDCDEICAVSMAMVCKLLPASDARWIPDNNDLTKQIHYRFTHYQWMHSGARNSFEFMEEKHNTDEPILSPSEFAPRDIIEVIENIGVIDLQVYADYICERLVLLKDQRQRMYGADMAIARIKDYQREFCEDSGYNPKKDCFKYEDADVFVRDITWEMDVRNNYQQSKKAIEYYTEHYPQKEENDSKDNDTESPQAPETDAPQTKISEQDSNQPGPSSSDTAQLQGLIKELQDDLKVEKAKNAKLEEEIAVLCEPVKELSATEDVRMAFALQLFRAAGLKDEKLDPTNRQKIKVATLMMLLLDKRSKKKGNEAHTCAKWLSHRDYVTSANKELIIDINKLFHELDMNIALSLENPKG